MHFYYLKPWKNTRTGRLATKKKEKLKSQQGNRMSDLEVICFKTL